MERKIVDWKVKGMNRDLSVSAFNPEFSYENLNVTLTTNEYNTTMSWVNERGTKRIKLLIADDETNTLKGTPIGTAVINHQLVIFTTVDAGAGELHNTDYIYVFKRKTDYSPTDKEEVTLEGEILYKGYLNFSVEHPLETLVDYEAGHVQKVYWTDGVNQPRVINIAASPEVKSKWKKEGGLGEKVPDTYFDFVPAAKMNEKITVIQNQDGGGIFPSGVIQYCYTYVNKYMQQTNIIEVSPIYYLIKNNRAASPEETVSCNFTITIEDLDDSFDMVRLYSIHRTSLDKDVSVKFLEDLPITLNPDTGDYSVTFVDNGTIGFSVDPTEILYIGGRDITAETMVDKDNTLFLGNLTEKHETIDELQETVRELANSGDINIEFRNDDIAKQVTTYRDYSSTFYDYKSTLYNNQRKATTLKGGETYRFGFQLQKGTGEWSQPIFIMDKKNPLYPKTQVYKNVIGLISAESTLPTSLFDTKVYRKIRPVIVYPNIEDRSVLCQGVLNPTVFNIEDRKDGYPFAQASWYFRPYMLTEGNGDSRSRIDTDINAEECDSGADENDPWFNDHYRDVYVITVTVENGSEAEAHINMALIRGVLDYVYTEGDGDRFGEIDYLGAMRLPDIQRELKQYHEWAFTVADGERNYGIIKSICTSTEWSYTPGTFHIYQNLKTQKRGGGTYYYQKDEEPVDVDYYIFKFQHAVTGKWMRVIFGNMGSSIIRRGDYIRGYKIPYTHYDSLYTIDDYLKLNYDDTNTNEQYKKFGITNADGSIMHGMETQGAIKVYNNPYSSNKNTESNWKKDSNKNIESNNQFFIDQSIVTFNSPDIEFDTQVQKYSAKNIHMRVIGAIPITANTSSHRIINSSPMVETLHSVVQDGPNWISQYSDWGKGELDINVGYANINTGAGNRLVSEYLWNDSEIWSAKVQADSESADSDNVISSRDLEDFMVFPWQRSGSLNCDNRNNIEGASCLGTKKESNLLFSMNTEYLNSDNFLKFEDLSYATHLTENAEIFNYRLPKQGDYFEEIHTSDINYYPNIDKLLYNTTGYYIINKKVATDTDYHYPNYNYIETSIADYEKIFKATYNIIQRTTSPVQMKYKSTSHIVLAFNAQEYTYEHEEPTEDDEHVIVTEISHEIPILPYAELSGLNNTVTYYGKFTYPNDTPADYRTFWGDKIKVHQEGINIDKLFAYGDTDVTFTRHNFLWLGELYKEPAVRFGGNSKEAIRHNNWLPCGEAVELNGDSNNVTIKWTEGDTYYQRYDCLKTYAFTPDDPNQLVEILSFMCETHVNIDGRYDNNRGQLENHDMDPSVFNLLNTVYSQQNNFFTYKQFDTSDWVNGLKYPNQVYFSKPKTAGEDVDTWTNVTMSSIVDLDGDKGEITSLQKFGSGIITFQDSGIAQLLYNENAQIAPQVGVPIELANSGRVQGARYFSDHIGCSNKWSIANTPNGIYFMDSNEKSIYLFNGQLTNLSGGLGFNTWAKNNIPSGSVKWKPDGSKAFTSFYNKLSHSVLFVNSDTALAYSEDLKAFTSFYNYEGAPYFNNVDDIGVWISTSRVSDSGDYILYKHRAGDYCNIFDANVPYSMKFVCNPDPALDKIFSNIEMRATAYDVDDKELGTHEPYLPFDNIIVENEYQYGATTLRGNNGINSMRHFLQDTDNTLKRKFRIWRCDVPRNQNVSTNGRYRMDRMRNPWVYLKLIKDAAEDDARLPRTEIHDVMMHYYI